jgi:hypothetical protein
LQHKITSLQSQFLISTFLFLFFSEVPFPVDDGNDEISDEDDNTTDEEDDDDGMFDEELDFDAIELDFLSVEIERPPELLDANPVQMEIFDQE